MESAMMKTKMIVAMKMMKANAVNAAMRQHRKQLMKIIQKNKRPI